MLQEQKDKLEERILAYFDGALDKQSSKELLSEVQKSTESRALFKAHESLNQLISAARIPLETPLEAKRSIAERIPGLLAFIPGLLGGAQALPILSQSANPIWSFFAKIPLSTAISVGTSVAVLTTAGVIVKNKLDDNAASEHKAKVAVAQNQDKKAAAPQYQLATVPERDVAQPDVSHASAGVAAEENASHPANHTAAAPKDGANGSYGTHKSYGSLKSFATSNAASSTNANHAGVLPSTNNTNLNPKPIANTPAATDNQQPSVATISAVAPTESAAPHAGIVQPPTSVLTPLPMLFGEGIEVRPFVFAGPRFIFGSHVSGVEQNPVKSDGSTISFDVTLGLDFMLSELFAIRLEGGESGFAHQVLRAQQQTGFGTVPNFVSYSTVNIQSAPWATVGGAYTFDLIDGVPLTLNAGVGAAFLSPMAFLTNLGASAEIPVSSKFSLRPGITFDAAFTSANSARVGDAQPANAILINRDLNGGNMVSTALGVNLGFLIHF